MQGQALVTPLQRGHLRRRERVPAQHRQHAERMRKPSLGREPGRTHLAE